jgi:hypothetical protein
LLTDDIQHSPDSSYIRYAGNHFAINIASRRSDSEFKDKALSFPRPEISHYDCSIFPESSLLAQLADHDYSFQTSKSTVHPWIFGYRLGLTYLLEHKGYTAGELPSPAALFEYMLKLRSMLSN